MSNWCIVSIALLSIAIIALVVAFLVRRCAARSRHQDGMTRTAQPTETGDFEMLERIIALYERKFIGAAITKMMTERNVPFTIRHEVWERYPREYGDPVVGVSTIAEEASIPVQRAYALLSEWFSKNRVAACELGLDGERLRTCLHEKALFEAQKILMEKLEGV